MIELAESLLIKVAKLRYIPTTCMYLQGVGTRDFPEDNETLGGRFKECKRYLCSIKLQCMYYIFYLYLIMAVLLMCDFTHFQIF